MHVCTYSICGFERAEAPRHANAHRLALDLAIQEYMSCVDREVSIDANKPLSICAPAVQFWV